MLAIAKHQIIDGLKDAKFLFMFIVILAGFGINAFVYSERYEVEYEDWREAIRTTRSHLEEPSKVLQDLVNYPQRVVRPPSVLAFISDRGNKELPNAMTVNAFIYTDPRYYNRGNEVLSVLPAVDWSYIIGTLMSLMAVLISFGTICGEKRDGALRLLLSFSVSRMELFLGKYFGLLAVLIIALTTGVFFNLAFVSLLGSIPLNASIAMNIGWTFLSAVLILSFTLLAGMAVSSMNSRPSIALVVLLVMWILMVIAIPGTARLIGEHLYTVRSNFEIERELEIARQDIYDKHPEHAGNWRGDPFAENIPSRAALVTDLTSTQNEIRYQAELEKIAQAEAIQFFASFSPAGLFSNTLEKLSATGVTGFKNLMETARRYQRQLYSFAVERDKNDPDSPHLVYSWGTSSDNGVFSRKPVELSGFPRFHSLWRNGGLPQERGWPLWQLIVCVVLNLFMMIVSFVALMRYDPR